MSHLALLNTSVLCNTADPITCSLLIIKLSIIEGKSRNRKMNNGKIGENNLYKLQAVVKHGSRTNFNRKNQNMV